MKSISARVILCFSIFLISGFSFLQCNSSEKTIKNKSANDYFPLNDGNSWQYINEAPREETVLIDVNCIGTNEKGVFELNKYPFFANLNNSDRETKISIDDSGNVKVKNMDGLYSILLPAQGKWGDSYSWKFNDILNAYLTSKLTNIKTEAGNFDCIFIMFTDGFTFSYEMWLAKGKGIVKWGANRTNPPNPHPTYYVLKEFKGN
jgi:hypothetical protein